eukprot:4507761-Lingulodinium_polyedra.AAC.1
MRHRRRTPPLAGAPFRPGRRQRFGRPGAPGTRERGALTARARGAGLPWPAGRLWTFGASRLA